ncbi:glycoside hydrolase domain-containing protein [Nocardia sp. NPDC051570]|uniref:glycoside hydrolase domain-containing protein n=1 Tax=Nocardia sp. NPDC051570 TaxID=3364324 RepID=UPI00379242A7
MPLGIDYAAGRPSGAIIAAAGYAFVVRHLSDGGPGLPGKLLTPDEANDLRANNIQIVSNWETTATRMLDGYDAGVADATTALAQVLACAGRTDRPIYFSADFDATVDQQSAIDAYLRGAGSVIGTENVGIYGGYWPVSRALDGGTATWAWQTDAWSGGQLDPRIHIHQRNSDGYAYVDGVACDVNESRTTDYGQWSTPNTDPGGDMQLSDTLTDAYGNPVTVADVFRWISYHQDLTLDLLGGNGSRLGLPDTQKMTGHPELGGRDVVAALAAIGKALNITGFDPTKEQ